MQRMLETLWRDLRFTARMLAARPGWTAAAVVCLAIATGANTAAFTIVNGLLLRPLPFDQPDALVMVALREPSQPGTRPFSLREYRELSERATSVHLLARTFFPLGLAAGDGARMVQAEMVSGNYFETLRVKPLLGTMFDARADRPGAAPVAVISHRLWRLRFRSDPGVIGRTVRLNSRPVQIAGIAPSGFVGAMQLIAADVWLPAVHLADFAPSEEVETTPMFGVMGRLVDGVSAGDAEARLTPAAAILARARGVASPPAVVVRAATGFGVPPAIQGTVMTLSGVVYLMMALLMAIACANVAALVLARGVGRTREIAVRLSLGASRLQIARQLLIESFTLAVMGCVAGSLVAFWLTQALVARLSTPFEYIDYAFNVQPDGRVFAYAALVTALAAILCGIAPIRYASRVDVLDVLKQSAARGRSRESRRTLNVMVATQFAVSTALLTGAGMLLRVYHESATARPGFETRGLIAASLDVDQIRADPARLGALHDTILERLAAIPGVSAAGLTRNLPLGPVTGSSATVIADTAGAGGAGGAIEADGAGGAPGGASGGRVAASWTAVSPSYFRTLGLTIRQGRTFSDNEPARPAVAVIDETMARRLWPNASPIGRTFRVNRGDAEAIQVIGVIASTRGSASGSGGGNDGGGSSDGSGSESPRPVFYRPFEHHQSAGVTVMLRTRDEAGARAVFADVRRAVQAIDPDLAIVDLRTMDQVLETSVAQRRGPAAMLTAIGLLGLLLSAVGLYGVIAYVVRSRARELGIRLALGAQPADVRRLVLVQGFRIVGIGLAAGFAATFALAGVMRSLISGFRTLDPLTAAVVFAVLVGAGFAALYLPARWASSVDPAHTLRGE
jgi:putative ABC transport system permease protein